MKKESVPNSKPAKTSNPGRPEKDRYANTDRDEASLGVSRDREVDPGLADEFQPTWQPPESLPEPRPAEPIMNPTQQSNQSTNANSSPT